MNPSVLAASNLTKTFGKGSNAFTALRGVSLDIKAGESVAIVGKSGSGKSTLMHLLALLDKPTSGSLMVAGQEASRLPGRKLNELRNKKFGFVFQQFFLNANASVLDNVILPLMISGVGRAERKRRGLEALRQVELEDKAKAKAKDLSGGQKQRVVIARALINNPEVIFADEPTGNLDSVTSQRIEELLFNLQKTQGITLLVVTHDEDLAARCQHIIYIKDGSIQNAHGAKSQAKPTGKTKTT
jgi:putative ABC transport system ATP-binding protein